ncbi:MAG: family 10 glycosylhydrolase [Armatimonadota bacterium]
MTGARPRPLCLLALFLAAGCGAPRPAPKDRPPPATFLDSPPHPQVLIVVESHGPEGDALSSQAQTLELLLAHFDLACTRVPARDYQPASVKRYQTVFYLSGGDTAQRTPFVSDLPAYDGIVVWVGPGAAALGERSASLKLTEFTASPSAASDWTVSYRGQSRRENVSVPAIACAADTVIARARRGDDSRPFACGGDRSWYVASGPSLDRDHFWTACIWADALHEMLGRPHADEPKRLVPVLRDVPVWTTASQVPDAVRPMRSAGAPVAVMAWTQSGEVPLADRPDAVRGLRAAEKLGATVVLAASAGVDPREHLRLAWEVGLHPLAWAGPVTNGNPFRLRIAPPDNSPPFSAGGLLPAPIAISDAGYIADEDAERLAMLRVVRDGVALASFGLWAPPKPFHSFLRRQESAGWMVSDLRELGARVEDRRRTVVSGTASVKLPRGAKVQQSLFGADWKLIGTKRETPSGAGSATLKLTAPPRGVAEVELLTAAAPHPFIKGVTLDPWAYERPGLSAKELAAGLADRYRQNGINTVFFYAYNVNHGAAYRTRYRGATMSDWGRQDLLGAFLEACHSRGIRVVAWMYSGRDRLMWKEHPGWRERTKDGKEYNPLRLHAAYFLCPRNPEVRAWYAGLLSDLGAGYPQLDGIELCEPVVNWFGDEACYCQVCQNEFAKQHPGAQTGTPVWRDFRSEGMTEFLSGCMRAIAEQGIDSYIMTLSDAWSNGAILTPRRQAQESGLDMEAVLNGHHPPDWVNYEIIWQQWAALRGTAAFNYDWAEETARRLARRTDGRARVIYHLELTDFGSQRMTPEKMEKTIQRVARAQPDGVECYHSRALDSRSGWPMLKRAYGELP